MAHNIFHTATDWVSDNVIDPVTNYVVDKGTDMYINNLKQDYVDSVVEAFGGPKTITPEMEAQGWKYGLDGVPYNSTLNEKFEEGGIFYDPDAEFGGTAGKERMLASQSSSPSSTNNATTSTTPFLSQDLRQRTPSGTIYNPSMEAYNNASLFDYAGPGGVAEYTYGQGLPMDYGVYGTPPGPNLYYEGQFGEGYVEPGVADSAIDLPPITMPEGVPQVPTPKATQPNMPAFTGSGSANDNQVLNNSIGSGMDSGLLVSQADQGPDIGLPGYTNNGTISAADQAIFDNARRQRFNPTGGPSIYDTQYTVGANNLMSPVGPNIYDTQYTVGANNAMSPIGANIYDTQYTVGANNAMSPVGPNIYDTQYTVGANNAMSPVSPNAYDTQYTVGANNAMSPVSPNAYDTQYTVGANNAMSSIGDTPYSINYSPVPYQIGGEEQVFDGSYEMQPSDDGTFNYGTSQTNQGNFETANQMVGGSVPTNIMRNPNEDTIGTIYVDPRTLPEIDDVPIPSDLAPSFPADYGQGTSIVTMGSKPTFNTNPSREEIQAMMNDAIIVNLQDIETTTPSSGMTMPESLQEGGDEEGRAFYNEIEKAAMDAMAGANYLGIDDNPAPAPAVPLSTNKDFYRQLYAEGGYQDPSEYNPFFDALAMDANTEVSVFEPQPYVPPIMNIDSYEYDGSYDSAPYSDAAIEAVVANTINRNPEPVSIPSIFRAPKPAPVTVVAGPPNRNTYANGGYSRRVGGR